MKTLLRRLAHRLIWPFLDGKLNVNDGRLLRSPWLAGGLIPLQEGSDQHVTRLPRLTESVPPPELRDGYGRDENEYLLGGRNHVEGMLQIIRDAGGAPETFPRVLELGCAAARMLRHYPFESASAERWGVDISAKHIDWCQRNLGPPFLFATTTTTPHLPFADGYFDLVYGGSVFTHITDLADAWFLELRRVLADDGWAYVTIHDKHTLQLLRERRWDWAEPLLRDVERVRWDDGAAKDDFACFWIDGAPPYPLPQVFYDVDWLARKWGRLMTLVSVTPDAYGYQTALLFRRRQST